MCIRDSFKATDVQTDRAASLNGFDTYFRVGPGGANCGEWGGSAVGVTGGSPQCVPLAKGSLWMFTSTGGLTPDANTAVQPGSPNLYVISVPVATSLLSESPDIWEISQQNGQALAIGKGKVTTPIFNTPQ